MDGLIYLTVVVACLVYKTKEVKPHFHHEKLAIVVFAVLWPIALFSWAVTNISVLIIDLIQGE